MEQQLITAETRDTGTSAARALRRQGLVPAIVYGKGIDSVPVSLKSGELRKLLAKGVGHIYKLVVKDAGLNDNIMIQSIDTNPITGEIIHMDLHRISMEELIRLEIPIVLVGEEAITLKELILQRQLREVTVECLPANIPSEFTIDVSDMDHGDTLLAGDLPLSDDVKLVTDPEEVVAVIVGAMMLEEEEVEEEVEGEIEEAADEDERVVPDEEPETF